GHGEGVLHVGEQVEQLRGEGRAGIAFALLGALLQVGMLLLPPGGIRRRGHGRNGTGATAVSSSRVVLDVRRCAMSTWRPADDRHSTSGRNDAMKRRVLMTTLPAALIGTAISAPASAVAKPSGSAEGIESDEDLIAAMEELGNTSEEDLAQVAKSIESEREPGTVSPAVVPIVAVGVKTLVGCTLSAAWVFRWLLDHQQCGLASSRGDRRVRRHSRRPVGDHKARGPRLEVPEEDCRSSFRCRPDRCTARTAHEREEAVTT